MILMRRTSPVSLGQDLARIYGRELDRLAGEIAAYPTDASLWWTMGAQKNSPGVLALHTVGGLLAFIGAGLGGTNYVRDRDREFSARDVPRDEIVRRVKECRALVVSILESLDNGVMGDPYPGQAPPALKDVTTQGFLMHLLWHVGWHTGHVYYHRLGMMAPAES